MCCSAAHCHPMSAVPRSIFSHVCCAHPMTAHPSQPAAASCRACKKHRGRYCAPSGDHRCRNVAESPTCLRICCGTTCTPSHVQAAKLQPVHMLRKTLQANTRAARNSKCLHELHTTLHAAHNAASLDTCCTQHCKLERKSCTQHCKPAHMLQPQCKPEHMLRAANWQLQTQRTCRIMRQVVQPAAKCSATLCV